MNLQTTPLVSTALDGAVLTLSLGAMPAHPLSEGMIDALDAAIRAAGTDPAVRAVIIDGPGHIFCAGHDLKEIARHRDDPDQGRAYLTALFESCAQMMQAVSTCPKPVIAMVDGIATAAGLQLMAACDMAIVSERASFCLPGIRRGGFCTLPSVTVSRVIGQAALMELLFSGTPHDADWALRVGLVSRVVPHERLERETRDFATDLAANFTPISAEGKLAVARHLDMPLPRAYEHATAAMIAHFMDPARIARERANPFGAGR